MRCLAFALLSLVLISSLQALTINVPDDYQRIQAAINNSVDGDTVLVADGTYTGPGNRDIDFGGRAIVVMSENGPEGTLIDCEGAGRGFYFHNGEVLASVVDGFTIKNGSAGRGGGMYNYESSPKVTNCAFIDNWAWANDYIGGGAMCNIGSSPMVTDCTFDGNSAGKGGGGMCNSGGNPTVTNCIFRGNSTDYGGGMFNSNSSPMVTNCTFSNNLASSSAGGGGMHNTGSSPTISDCTFSENSSPSGGGIYSENSSLRVTNSTFNGNSATWDGGGMVNAERSRSIVINCVFTGNTAVSGGGMMNGDSNATISNCVFGGNAVRGSGGGMSNHSSNPRVTNCIFTGNTAETHGGGMNNDWWCRPTVTNCTFTENTAETRGGGMYNFHYSSTTVSKCIFWDDFPDEIYNIDSSPIVTDSNVQGGYSGIGNIDADPLFFTLGGFDHFLGSGSPCIDTGSSYMSPGRPTEDGISDWHPRWPEWLPNGPRSDMGAYGGPGNVGWLQ